MFLTFLLEDDPKRLENVLILEEFPIGFDEAPVAAGLLGDDCSSLGFAGEDLAADCPELPVPAGGGAAAAAAAAEDWRTASKSSTSMLSSAS